MMHDIDGTDTVICPHCGADNGTDEMYTTRNVDCCSCGKVFHVEPDYSVTYSTSCVDHTFGEWAAIVGRPGLLFRRCSVCDKLEAKIDEKGST